MPKDYVEIGTVRYGKQNDTDGEDFGVIVAVKGDLDFEADIVAARIALLDAYEQVDNVLDSIIKGVS